MTKADRIRSMSDLEMAIFFTMMLSRHQKDILQDLANKGVKIAIIETPTITAAHILRNLKQPVEGEWP